MLHRPYGPRGAESEDPEFWTDLTRNSDFLPEPGIVNPVLRSAQELIPLPMPTRTGRLLTTKTLPATTTRLAAGPAFPTRRTKCRPRTRTTCNHA